MGTLDDEFVAQPGDVGQARDVGGVVEPAVTSAASAPSMRAMAAPAASLSSSMFTSACAASRMASIVSGRIREPP